MLPLVIAEPVTRMSCLAEVYLLFMHRSIA